MLLFFNLFFLPVHKWNNPSKRQVDGSLAKTMEDTHKIKDTALD